MHSQLQDSGFFIIKNDTLLYEKYNRDYHENSIFNLFSDNARYCYGRNLRKLVRKAKLNEKPGREIHYSSVNVQLLGLMLERATGTDISTYLQEKIWQKIGMQYDARWNVDNNRKKPIEKCFSNLNCTAIDLAKLGRLYLNNGYWDNQRILSEKFIYEATCRDTTDGSSWNFQYNFKPGPSPYDSFYASGLFGQLLLIHPSENIIIVRVGEPHLNNNPQFIRNNIFLIIEQMEE